MVDLVVQAVLVVLVVLVDQLCHLGEWIQVFLERSDRAAGDPDECRRHACPLYHDHLCDLTLASRQVFELQE
jgi:hypothetical protein